MGSNSDAGSPFPTSFSAGPSLVPSNAFVEAPMLLSASVPAVDGRDMFATYEGQNIVNDASGG